MAKKLNIIRGRAISKTDRVGAFDSKYTGEEPDWTDSLKWDVEKYRKERIRMLEFYNYYLGSKELQPSIITWMQKAGYSDKDVNLIKESPDWLVPQTIGKFCRAFLKGMPYSNPLLDIDDEAYVREGLAAVLPEAARVVAEKVIVAKEADSTAPKVNPRERLQSKVTATVLSDLDDMVDSWVNSGNDKIEKVDIRRIVSAHGIAPMGYAFIVDYISSLKTGLERSLGKESDEDVAAYAMISAASIRKRISACEDMLSDLGMLKGVAKSQRKPRIKKAPAAEKQVARLKYLRSAADFAITSIDPVRAVGAQTLIVFNVKYRQLAVYFAQSESGLAFKGQSVINTDDTKSVAITLRKPKEVLPKVLQTPKKIEKIIAETKTKTKKPNGRFNDNIAILYAN
jgi:hypothetical protein